MNTIPNFFIVGAPKAGTTSLYEYLSRHPEVYMPAAIKEPDYFSHEEIVQQQLYYKTTHVKDAKGYKALFAGVTNQKAVGEASVSYLFYPQTANKIYKFNPAAKIIIILREPVERAYSHYLMDYRLGLLDAAFEDIIFRKLEHRYADMYFQQVVSLGEYAEQITRYLEVFSPDQVKILFYDHLKTDPGGVMKSIFKFLEIDEAFPIDTSQRFNAHAAPKNGLVEKMYKMHHLRRSISQLVPEALKNSFRRVFFKQSKKPEISAEAKAYLTEHYRNDVQKIRELTGFAGWLESEDRRIKRSNA